MKCRHQMQTDVFSKNLQNFHKNVTLNCTNFMEQFDSVLRLSIVRCLVGGILGEKILYVCTKNLRAGQDNNSRTLENIKNLELYSAERIKAIQ